MQSSQAKVELGADRCVPAVRRVEPVPAEVRSASPMRDPGYVDLFVLTTTGTGASPERWARLLLEDVGGRVAQLVWRRLLGLRLRPAPDRVAGWAVAGHGPDFVRLEARSWFLTGNLVVRVDGREVSLATLVRYDRRLGAVVWRALAPAHRRAAPGLLRDACALATSAR